MKSPLQLTINKANIIAQVAQFLNATKSIPHNVEVLDIKFTDINKEQVKLEVYFKEEEVKLTYF